MWRPVSRVPLSLSQQLPNTVLEADRPLGTITVIETFSGTCLIHVDKTGRSTQRYTEQNHDG